MKIILTVIFLVLWTTACSSEESGMDTERAAVLSIPEHLRDVENLTVYPPLDEAEPAYSIRFEKDGTFESASDVIDVDDTGRLYSAGRNYVRVYEPDGTRLQDLGGPGFGPGEFNSMGILNVVAQSGMLYVLDEEQQRFNIFSLETLSPAHTILMAPYNWSSIDDLRGFRPSSDYFVREDGDILVGFKESTFGEGEKYRRYYLMDSEGAFDQPADKIVELIDTNFYEGSSPPAPIPPGSYDVPLGLPYTRSSLIDVSDDGYIFTAWTEEFLIRVLSPDGTPLRAIYYPYENSLLDPESIIGLYDGDTTMQGRVEEVEFPETWPALDQMIVDDENRLWIATITDSDEEYQWWVLDEYGELLASFTWPARRLERHRERKEIRMVKNGYLYVHTRDPSGSRSIERYQIVMEEDTDSD